MTDEPTHRMKVKDDKNGDTGEKIEEEKGNGPEEREGEGGTNEIFPKKNPYIVPQPQP